MPAFLRWLLRLGPTNPICVRLVQGGSRRLRHHYLRTAYLAVLIGVLMWTLILTAPSSTLSYRELAIAGATSFKWTAYLQIGLICLLAPIFMAGAIAQEANPRTWDILLTTPLSAAQIVLGNLFGRLFFILALLFASLPLFAITQYFGGAAGSAIFASYAIAACTALLVGAIAISLSVSRLVGRRAVFSFYISVVSYLAITWAVDLAIRSTWGGVTPLTALNPFLALESLLDPTGYRRPEGLELASMSSMRRLWLGSPALAWCLASAGASVLLMLGSATTVRRFGLSGAGLKDRILRRSKAERTRTPRSVWHNPIAWREAAARNATLPRIIARWSFIAVGLLWAIGVLIMYHTGGIGHSELRFTLVATTWTEMAVITLIAINLAGAAVSREREDGTLDLLLITPVTPGQYLGGKLRGLVSYLAPLIAVPVATIALAALYVLLALGGMIVRDAGVTSADPTGVVVADNLGTGTINIPVILPIGAIVLPLVVIPFTAFCVMVGLQWSLKSKGAIGSVVAAFGIVAAVSAAVGLCGWRAGQDIALVGPVLACLNPATAVFALVHPADGAMKTLQQSRGALNVSLLVGGVVAAGVYTAIVYALHASMVRTFDMTVRRLAGVR